MFRTRFPNAMSICTEEKPAWKEQEIGHFMACHLYK
ncbi:hypothetical protein [Psychrobacillus sp. L4]